MAMDITLLIRADASQASRSVRDLSSDVDDLGRSAAQAGASTSSSAGAMADALKGLGSIVAGLGFASFGMEVMRVNIGFEALRASLTTVIGSAELANKAFDGIKSFAASTPFSLQEVTQAFIKMQSLGIRPTEAALTSYGNTAAAMGKSLDQMVEAVADAATGEFERLKEFGIKASVQGDHVSMVFRGVTTTIGNNAAEINGYLQSIGEKDFASGMELQSKTLAGALANVGDSWNNMLDSLLDDSAMSTATGLMKDLSAWLDYVATDGFASVRIAAVGMAAEVEIAWLDIEAAAVDAWDGVAETFSNALDDVLGAFHDAIVGLKDALKDNIFVPDEWIWSLRDLADATLPAKKATDDLGDAAKGTAESMREQKERIREAATETVSAILATKDHKASLDEVVNSLGGYATATGQSIEETKRLKKEHDEAARAAKKHKDEVNGMMVALAAEAIELTHGARAAYEYALANKGLTQSEIDTQMALYDSADALRKKAAAEDEAAKAAEKAAKENEKNAGAFSKLWEQSLERVDGMFLDLWKGAFDSTKDFGAALKDWFKSLLAELAHAAITRPIVVQVGALLTGAGAAGGAQAGGFDVASLFGGGGAGGGFGESLMNMALGAGGLWSFLGSGLAGMAGGSAFLGSMAGGMVGAGSGLTGMFGALGSGWAAMTGGSFAAGLGTIIGAALPVLLPALLIPLLTSAFGDDNANSEIKLWAGDNFAGGGNAAQIGTGKNWASEGEWFQVDTPFGKLGAGGRHIGVADDDQIPQEEFDKWLAQMEGAFKAIAALDAAVVDVFGLTDETIAAIAAEVESMEEEVKKMGTPDIEGFLAERYAIIFGGIDETAAKLFQGMQQTSGGVGTVQVVKDLTTFYATIDAYEGVAESFDEMLADSKRSMLEVAAAQEESMRALIDGYDGSYEKTLQLTQAMQQRYQIEMQMLAAIEQVSQGIASSANKMRDDLLGSIMTPEQRFADSQQTANDALAAMATETDPAKIAAYWQQWEQAMRQNFEYERGLLDQQHQERRGALATEHDASLSAINAEHDEQVRLLATEHQTRMDTLTQERSAILQAIAFKEASTQKAADLSQQMYLDTLTPEQMDQYLRDQAESAITQMQNTSDPEEVARLWKQFISSTETSWNSLTEEQKKGMLDIYQDSIDKAEAIKNARLGDLGGDLSAADAAIAAEEAHYADMLAAAEKYYNDQISAENQHYQDMLAAEDGAYQSQVNALVESYLTAIGSTEELAQQRLDAVRTEVQILHDAIVAAIKLAMDEAADNITLAVTSPETDTGADVGTDPGADDTPAWMEELDIILGKFSAATDKFANASVGITIENGTNFEVGFS